MTRIYIAAGLFVALAAAFTYARWDAVRDERARVNQITEERKDDISEGINSCADLEWFDRLRCTDK